jgi:hypothetical protein
MIIMLRLLLLLIEKHVVVFVGHESDLNVQE